VPGNKWLGDCVESREMSGSEQGKGRSNADALRVGYGLWVIRPEVIGYLLLVIG
jgi:hypothetical protein